MVSTLLYLGHIEGGLFTAFNALLYTYTASQRNFRSLQQRRRHHNEIEFFCYRFSRRYPIDSLLKLWLNGVMVVGLVGSFSWGNQDRMRGQHRIQHLTVFSLWTLYALVEMASFLRIRFLHRDAAYLFYIFGCAAETHIFYNHLHGRNALDQYIHSLQALCCLGKAVCALGEMCARHSLSVALARYLCQIVEGLWLATMAFVWLPAERDWPEQEWPAESAEHRVLASLYFTWLAGATTLLVFAVAWMAPRLLSKDCGALSPKDE